MHFFQMKGAWTGPMVFLYERIIAARIGELYDQLAEFFFSDLPAGCRVLDLGCGSGPVSVRVAQANPTARITGVDLSLDQIHNAKQRARGLANTTFERGDAMNLAYPEGHFDIALSVASIKHWPDGVHGLAEMRRVCKTGGLVYVLEVHKDSTKLEARDFISRWKFSLPGTRSFTTWYFRRFIGGQGLSQGELLDLMKAAGFAEIYVQSIPSQPFIVALGIKS